MAYRGHDNELYKCKLAAKKSPRKRKAKKSKQRPPPIGDRVERWARIAMKSIVVTSAIGIIGFALYTTVFDSEAKEGESPRIEWLDSVKELVAAPVRLAQDGLFGGQDAPRSGAPPASSPPPRTEAPRGATPRTPSSGTGTSHGRASGGGPRSAPIPSLPPERPVDRVRASATAGFQNKPPGGVATAAGADGADESVAEADTATAAPGTTTPPADPRISKLLAAEVFQPRDIRTELVWPASDAAFAIEAKLDPAAPDSASTGLLRRATATFIGRASRDGRQVSGPFDQSDSGEDVWVFRGTETVSNPLQIPVYFLGERFRNLTLLPARANRNKDRREGDFIGQRLGHLKLVIRNEDGYGERQIPGVDLEQRLIRDLEGVLALSAWLICDGPCDNYRGAAGTHGPEEESEEDADADQPIEIRFTFDGKTVTDKAELQRLIDDNPFTQCLKDNGIKPEPVQDGDGETFFVRAERNDADCADRYKWAEYVDADHVVSIDVDRWEEDERQQFRDKWGKEKIAFELRRNGRRDRLASGRFSIFEKADPDRRLGPVLEPKNGWVVVKREVLSGDSFLLRGSLEGFADVDRDFDDSSGPIVDIDLSPAVTLAQIDLVPVFRVPDRGDATFLSADRLVIDGNCTYTVAVGKGGETPGKDPTLTAKDRDGQKVLSAGDDGAGVKISVGEVLSLRAKESDEAPAGTRCLEQDDGVRDKKRDEKRDKRVTPKEFENRLIEIPIRHPTPWLLLGLTVADLPQPDLLGPVERSEDRNLFWYRLLKTVHEKQDKWRFATAVDISNQGKAETRISGAGSKEDVRNNSGSLMDLTDDGYELLLKPEPGTLERLNARPLEGALKHFASLAYAPVQGSAGNPAFHTTLLVWGEERFNPREECAGFRGMAVGLAQQQIALVVLVPAGEIAPETGDAQRHLKPFDSRGGFEGVLTCNPDRFAQYDADVKNAAKETEAIDVNAPLPAQKAALEASTLIVYPRTAGFGRLADRDEKARNALEYHLNELTRDR
jgi:hypothetical protein